MLKMHKHYNNFIAQTMLEDKNISVKIQLRTQVQGYFLYNIKINYSNI